MTEMTPLRDEARSPSNSVMCAACGAELMFGEGHDCIGRRFYTMMARIAALEAELAEIRDDRFNESVERDLHE